MCGIAGIVSLNPALVQQQKLQSMATALEHRGPDGQGFWINENGQVGFAHRRLSVIDLSSAGSQPMHYLDRYTIVYNGEIYNYLELREELKKKGYQFHSDSDTEVVLAAYDCYGSECVQHFDGMFALAIWDNLEQHLFAARDRFGEKPFHYFLDGEQFVFASEMKALWAMGIAKQRNNAMLLNYLTIGYTSNALHPEQSFFEAIHKLPAASRLGYYPHSGQLTIDKYWDLDKEHQPAFNIDEAQEQFRYLFFDAVNKRLRSDVAVGTSLSGGLDSSSIVAAIQASGSNGQAPNLQTFSAVFPGFEKDESKYISMVAEQFRLQRHTVGPTAAGFINDFDRLMYHQEEPIQSASIYAQYKVYELARQYGVTVLLDGQGADETLGGYDKYHHWYWQELLKGRKFGLLQKERETTTKKVDWGYRNYMAAFFPSLAAKRLETNLYRQVKDHPSINTGFLAAHFDRTMLHKPVVEKLNDMLYYNTLQLGLEELLRYADRNSMAFSREVRLPFLSHELVEFIFSLPSSCKIKEGNTKWLLRKTMDQRLPSPIVWRKDKIGFEPPQYTWMQEPAVMDMIHESKKKLVQQGILKPSSLEKPVIAVTAHAAGNLDWRYLSAACML